MPANNELPPELDAEFGGKGPVKSVTLQPGMKILGLDADEALRDIQSKGYHIASPTLVFRETVA